MHGMCPKGFSFSPLSQTCNHNIDVDCQSCSPHGIQNIAYPDNCSWYYRCVNGVRTTMSCSDGLLFDRSYGDCNIAQRVVCETKNTICEPFAQLAWLGAILIGNPLDCSRYEISLFLILHQDTTTLRFLIGLLSTKSLSECIVTVQSHYNVTVELILVLLLLFNDTVTE